MWLVGVVIRRYIDILIIIINFPYSTGIRCGIVGVVIRRYIDILIIIINFPYSTYIRCG